MRNRRSFFESQKESFIREAYANNPNDFILNGIKFIEKNSSEEMLAAEFDHTPGASSSAEIESKFRYNLVSNLETINNTLSIKEEELVSNHRSYINAFKDIERKYDKLEREANRELLLLTDESPFEYGITDNLSTQEFVNEEKTSAYWYGGQFMLAPKSFKRNQLDIKSIVSNIKVRGGSLKEVQELSNKKNILKKDGSNYKLKAEASTAYSVVELELIIELNNAERIDKLEIVSTAVESLKKESIRVVYSKDGAEYLSAGENDYERLSSGFNTFDINEEDVRIIKIFIQKNAADSSSNNKNEYLFLIDFVGNVEYIYESENEVHLGPYFITDIDNSPVDFDLATINTGTCCVIQDETSIDFSISKDGENYVPISYFDNGNTVVEFKNQINESIFLRKDEALPDIIREEGSSNYRLNRYIPEDINFLESSLIVKRGVGEWIETNGKYSTTIEINSIEGRFFNLGDTNLKVNGAEKSGILFLNKGFYEIETSSYEEINTKNIVSESTLRARDRLYPYNHKYLFEGLNYSRSFIGDKKYLGADSLFGQKLKKVTLENLNSLDKSSYALKKVEGEGTVIMVSAGSSSEEVYLDCKSEAAFGNNEVYLKAVLKSDNEYKTPRIDSIQIRVV